MTAMSCTYQPLPRARLVTAVGIVLLWLVALSTGGSTPWPVSLGALVVAAALTWLFGTRFAHTATVEGGEVAWKALLRRGRIPVSTMRRIRPAHFEKTMLVLEGPRGRGPFVAGGTGVAAFLDALRAERADLPVELGKWAGRLEAADRDKTTGPGSGGEGTH
jgi:hypothetical protein